MSGKAQNLISLVIIIVGVALAFMIFGPDKDKNQVESTNPNFATKVGTIVVGEGVTRSADVYKTAVLESKHLVGAVAEQGGRISQVNFKVGDSVTNGQVLAYFDQSNNVNSAKVALEDSQTNLSLADDNLSKTKKSADENIEIAENNRRIDELELEQAEDGGDQDEIDLAEENLKNSKDAEDKAEYDAEILVNNAKIQVAQAEATVRQNQIAYEKSIIKAPVSGIITAKNINRYDYVSAGSEIAEISSEGQLKTTIYLSSFEVDKVKEGDSVLVSSADKEYSGEIESVSLVANSNNNRYEVQIKSSESLISEANKPAKIKITLNLNTFDENIFFVPLSAVSIGQQRNTVFLEENGIAKIVEVEMGQTVESQVEIVSGLKNGDELIVENNRGLREGDNVEVQE